MIDRILMELYDDYENNNINSLIEFTNKTLPRDGTNKFFIGCVLILFSRTGVLKPRYHMTREKLYDIVTCAKKKVNNTNLLLFYIDRINTTKGISNYFKNINKDNIDKYADLVIEYLDSFKPSFTAEVIKLFQSKKSVL